MSALINSLVSVCMITYNHEQFIRKAIEGVLFQVCDFTFELVIGEDFSTDSTQKICLMYVQKYPGIIRLLPLRRNLGMIPNFFRTLQACTGKYIAICEGDDYWTDQYKLQKQVDFLENNPEYGMIYGNRFILELDGTFNPFIPTQISSFEDLLKKNSIPTETTCFRSCLLSQYILETFSISKNWALGDYPIWLWIYLHSKIKHLNDFVSVYRRHEGSATDYDSFIKGETFFLSCIAIKTFFYSYYEGKTPLRDFVRREYGFLFKLSIQYRKILKCFKYFSYNPFENIDFVLKSIKHKILMK